MTTTRQHDADSTDGLDFRLVSIARHAAPAEAEGNDWFAYKISQGANVITGYRRGTLSAVTEAVNQLIETLNLRRGVRRGRVDLRPSARPANEPASS